MSGIGLLGRGSASPATRLACRAQPLQRFPVGARRPPLPRSQHRAGGQRTRAALPPPRSRGDTGRERPASPRGLGWLPSRTAGYAGGRQADQPGLPVYGGPRLPGQPGGPGTRPGGDSAEFHSELIGTPGPDLAYFRKLGTSPFWSLTSWSPPDLNGDPGCIPVGKTDGQHGTWCFAWEPGQSASQGTDKAALLKETQWNSGDIITVSFLDGDPGVQEKVKRYAQEWTAPGLANLTLEFRRDTNDTLIRISFRYAGLLVGARQDVQADHGHVAADDELRLADPADARG